MDADPRGRLPRKHRVCGGKPTSNQPTALTAVLTENVWTGERRGGRGSKERTSGGLSLSDEIVFKWSGARNDDDDPVESLTLLYGDH